jgi:alpha-tubulin suppressor-like RCC1 family protein
VVVCWGWNNYGQLGYGGDPEWGEVKLEPDKDFYVRGSCTSPDLFAQSVGAGRFHACGVWTDQLGANNPGRICCWGANDYGQLGNGEFSERETMGVAIDLQGRALSFVSVTSGDSHSCALASGGDAYCWGQNIYGQLGYGEFADSSAVPAPVEDGHTFVAIDAGLQHTCALEASGRAYCWGQNFFGQGGEPKSMRNRPTPVLTELTFLSISAGRNHTCGVSRPDGAVYCWGQNYSGQLGNGETNGFDEAIGVVRVAEPASR